MNAQVKTENVQPQTPKVDNPSLIDLLALKHSPVHFARALGIDPDPWQAEVLTSDSNRLILNCARQTGKSSIVALMALREALYNDKATIIIISHTLQQAAETFRKCHDYYRRAAKPTLSITDSVHRLELQNGSRIITLTGQRPDSIRGFSNVSLLVVDEAAQVLEDSYTYSRPMLAVSDGRIILLSTPHGKRGFFWDSWNDYQNENTENWHGVEIDADKCPRFTKAFIWSEKMRMLDWEFKQEYYCHFAEAVDSVFKAEDINAAFSHEGIYVRDEIDLSLDDL